MVPNGVRWFNLVNDAGDYLAENAGIPVATPALVAHRQTEM